MQKASQKTKKKFLISRKEISAKKSLTDGVKQEEGMIDTFAFGSIVIDGRRYASDLLIYPDGHVQDAWRRGRGHVLSQKDIAALIASRPQIIIAGTGVNGRMRPEGDLERVLSQRNIRFMAAPNDRAIQWFNDLCQGSTVGACFHLTC